MYLCYIDESGTPDIPGNTSHYVLAGISIPVQYWKECDTEIELIKKRFDLLGQEIHVAWILRKYLEQSKIPHFEHLPPNLRRSEVMKQRTAELLRLQKTNNPAHYKQTRKNFQKTESYIHLTYTERQELIREIAQKVADWEFARLFCECIDKRYYDPVRTGSSVDEQAFEQVVSRFEQYLQRTNGSVAPNSSQNVYGLLVHDNNETVAKKHTDLMKKFHQTGTLWTNVENIIETPFFVNSQLTSMVQVADMCGYAVRRYIENGEEELFNSIFKRVDRKGAVVVGVRHFTTNNCQCKICISRRRTL